MVKKVEFTTRRPGNSLSRKKFIDRLDKGLPIFIAHGAGNDVECYENCRDLHTVKWEFKDGSADFIHVTRHYEFGDCHVERSLTDMNVLRNTYNHNFVFRTKWAAEQWLLSRRTT